MRYWKGAYDEDRDRARHLRQVRGENDRDEDAGFGVFHALVGVQILMAATAAAFSLAELFSNSR